MELRLDTSRDTSRDTSPDTSRDDPVAPPRSDTDVTDIGLDAAATTKDPGDDARRLLPALLPPAATLTLCNGKRLWGAGGASVNESEEREDD